MVAMQRLFPNLAAICGSIPSKLAFAENATLEGRRMSKRKTKPPYRIRKVEVSRKGSLFKSRGLYRKGFPWIPFCNRGPKARIPFFNRGYLLKVEVSRKGVLFKSRGL